MSMTEDDRHELGKKIIDLFFEHGVSFNDMADILLSLIGYTLARCPMSDIERLDTINRMTGMLAEQVKRNKDRPIDRSYLN